MTADGHQVYLHFVDIDWNLPNSLGSICVEEHFVGPTDGSCVWRENGQKRIVTAW